MSLIGNIDDFATNTSTSLEADFRKLLVVRRGDQLYVYENSCPHVRDDLDPEGGSVVSDDGLLIVCQRHGAEFITETGECVAGPCLGEYLSAVAFTLSNGDIYLD